MVNTIISGHHIELTEALKTHIQRKSQLLNNHFDKLDVKFILKKEGDVHVAEANTRLLGKSLNTSVEGQDMYVLITQLVRKLDRVLRRFKNKSFS
jgi:putative sigma-54 modulation protein